MADGGFVRLPSGGVIVALVLPRPDGCAAPGCDGGSPGGPQRLRVLVHAANRQRALTRLRNAGFRGARLAGNTAPPTYDEVNAVLHHPDGLVWRPRADGECQPWRPISALRRSAVRR